MGQKYNKIQFDSKNQQIKHLLKNNELRQIIANKNWILNNGKYRKLQCKLMFSHLSKISDVQTLNFRANNQPNIPESISHLSLSSVLNLNICGNYICSLEKLTFLNMRNLQVLDLEWNFITSLDSFCKTSFKHLQKLNICHNPLLTFGKFQRSITSKLKQLLLEDQDQHKQSVSDAVWKLTKIQTNSLYALKVKASNRIKLDNPILIKTIKKKSPSCAIQRAL